MGQAMQTCICDIYEICGIIMEPFALGVSMKTGSRDAELLGVVSSLARIARVIIRERRHLRLVTPLLITLIAYMAIWPDVS
jgi:hypothetical protein